MATRRHAGTGMVSVYGDPKPLTMLTYLLAGSVNGSSDAQVAGMASGPLIPVASNIESNIECNITADIACCMVDIRADERAGKTAGSFQFDFE